MTKKSKVSEKDRISDLPDALLLIILSLLPTEQAVRTSILSKRWRPLCISLPNLVFYHRNWRDSAINFANFVDRFLMHRPNDLKIEKFGLHCVEDYYLDRVGDWILNALEFDAKEIDLWFRFREMFVLMYEVFFCTCLEKLQLSGKILVDIPENVKFSSLRFLKFDEITFSSYESIGELLIKCPVLEVLYISGCKWLSGCCLRISGSALKKFSLVSYSRIDEKSTLEISIETPGLETLILDSFASDDILIKKNLPFLTTAQIEVVQIIEGVAPSSVFGDCTFGLLNKITHVKSLSLGGETVEALNRAYHSDFSTVHNGFPPFHNLTDLSISVDEAYCGQTLLYDFLENSPNLESLFFPQGLVDTFSDQTWRFTWAWSWSHTAECLSTHLKTVDIGEFSGTVDELSFVEYLLAFGSALTIVSITSSNLHGGKEVREELLKYERKSTTCKLNLFF
ncbi:F-box/LRR-repeat protein At3g26922-like [Apium graveolens]|uniref:F-box/LRR-repeat protein At3g26922-like n=1 Tax=Apium graveolens TaxID=4045 RepID=UPI003D7ACBD4